MTTTQERMPPEEIKAARARLHLSQMGLANAIGAHVATIIAWENGRNPISGPADTAIRLMLERLP